VDTKIGVSEKLNRKWRSQHTKISKSRDRYKTIYNSEHPTFWERVGSSQESFQEIWCLYDHEPHTTIRNLLVHPKDKVNTEETAECVYRIPCKNCQEVYIGETGRSLGVRMKEHRKEVDQQEGYKYTRSTKRQPQSEQNTRRIRSRTDDRGGIAEAPEFEGASNSRNANRFMAIFGRISSK